ncbi:hypothetical protein CR983_01200 [Candidatus Saccharibacteria bacterium]|nr:MAG: hypothetical protein CR983_01200 [Candidatus Saccharibacteria bacterium]
MATERFLGEGSNETGPAAHEKAAADVERLFDALGAPDELITSELEAAAFKQTIPDAAERIMVHKPTPRYEVQIGKAKESLDNASDDDATPGEIYVSHRTGEQDGMYDERAAISYLAHLLAGNQPRRVLKTPSAPCQVVKAVKAFPADSANDPAAASTFGALVFTHKLPGAQSEMELACVYKPDQNSEPQLHAGPYLPGRYIETIAERYADNTASDLTDEAADEAPSVAFADPRSGEFDEEDLEDDLFGGHDEDTSLDDGPATEQLSPEEVAALAAASAPSGEPVEIDAPERRNSRSRLVLAGIGAAAAAALVVGGVASYKGADYLRATYLNAPVEQEQPAAPGGDIIPTIPVDSSPTEQAPEDGESEESDDEERSDSESDSSDSDEEHSDSSEHDDERSDSSEEDDDGEWSDSSEHSDDEEESDSSDGDDERSESESSHSSDDGERAEPSASSDSDESEETRE